MDVETRARWAAFQARHGLPNTGYPGQRTVELVERMESEAVTREILIAPLEARRPTATLIGRVLCVVPAHNSHGKADVTGAFLPESKRLVALAAEGSNTITFDNRAPKDARRAEVLRKLNEHTAGSFDSVAFFCHGWMTGIQAGFDLSTVGELAAAIVALTNGNPAVNVPLFCCSTGDDPEDDPITAPGSGDGSFADLLRDNLCQLGALYCSVWAHTTAAHTTWNPMAIRFDGAGSPIGGVGGLAAVRPGGALWERWVSALRAGDLRVRAPWLTVEEIHRELLEAAA